MKPVVYKPMLACVVEMRLLGSSDGSVDDVKDHEQQYQHL